MHRVTVMPGDGVGPEIVSAMRRCVEAAGVEIQWEETQAGADCIEEFGTPLPEEALESIRRNRVAIKGPVTTPVGLGFRSVNVAIRKALDLYVCLRPCRHYRGVNSNYPGLDLVVVRENTEDLYAGIEFDAGTEACADLRRSIGELAGADLGEDVGLSIKPISERASERIVRFAFEYARTQGRRLVTAVHKANIMRSTDGLFLDVARRVAEDYPEIEFEDRIIDNMCMQLVQKPELYDVIVTENLYGDILSDLCAGLVGGLSVAPGANLGDDCAVFEPVHGSAPKYAGQDRVNPTAQILTGVLMLRHLKEREAADRLEGAVAAVIAEGRSVTYDLKPRRDDPSAVGTQEMADAVIAALR